MKTKPAPVTPGELLWEELLFPMGISRYRLAKEIGVPAQRIGEIVAGRRAITADTDLRLCRFFGLAERCAGSGSTLGQVAFCGKVCAASAIH